MVFFEPFASIPAVPASTHKCVTCLTGIGTKQIECPWLHKLRRREDDPAIIITNRCVITRCHAEGAQSTDKGCTVIVVRNGVWVHDQRAPR